MNTKTFILLIACILFAACQKRKYPEEKIKLQEEEIFFNGFIGEEAIDLTIGEEGYYCFSSYKHRPDSIYVFEGELRRFDCNSCSSALRLEIYDYKHRLPNESIPAD